MQSQLCSLPQNSLNSDIVDTVLFHEVKESLIRSSAAILHHKAISAVLLHVKIRELFSIIAVYVPDRQSLDNRFQSPIFFSTIAFVTLDIQSLFGP